MYKHHIYKVFIVIFSMNYVDKIHVKVITLVEW